MKIRLVLLATCSLLIVAHATNPALAQTELTADNSIRPLLGHEVTALQYEATSPGDLTAIATVTGENQTWDFSGATFGEASGLTSEYREPPLDDLPGWRVWMLAEPQPNYANVALDVISEDLPDSVEISFFSYVDDTQLLNWGFSGLVDATDDGIVDTVLIGNEPPAVELMFPTKYGDEWSSEWTQRFLVLGGASFSGATTKRDKKVVGWGTLVTPMGSAEVLQIEQTMLVTVFGQTIVNEKTLEFIGPFQEAPGKRALINMSATVTLDAQGNVTSASHSTIEVEGDGGGNPTAVEGSDEVPGRFEIHANYPNPFNPSTTIPYEIARSGHVQVSVHDVLGRQVAIVFDGVVAAGNHTVGWEAGELPSGTYQVRVTMDGETRVRSMILQK